MDTGDGNCVGRTENSNNTGNNTKGAESEDEKDALGNTRYMHQNVVAKMPTERFATHYNMDHKYRGLAFIFNHEYFNVHGLRSRSGTQVDCETLGKHLHKLGFIVRSFQDLPFKKLEEEVTKASEIDYSDYDCLFMAVLSHGEMGILYAMDQPYKPEMLWAPFTADRCPTLAGKPKLYFIQACQGDKLDAGVTLTNRTETDGRATQSYRIPSQADFLIAYSTIPGYFSWRNTTRGSWFIQALCQELENNAYNHDLLTLLTFVCQRVAFDFESNTPDTPHMHQQKQIPCITTMLTRLLRFPSPEAVTASGVTPRLDGIELESSFEMKSKEKNKNVFSSIFTSTKTRSYTVTAQCNSK